MNSLRTEKTGPRATLTPEVNASRYNLTASTFSRSSTPETIPALLATDLSFAIEKVKCSEQGVHVSRHDELTGLATHCLLVETLGEFLRATGRAQGKLAVALLRACFAAPYVINGTDIKVGVKAGLAMFPHDGSDAETLLVNAGDRVTQGEADR